MSDLFSSPIAAAWLLMIIATAAAAVWDLRKFNVPNWLTLPLCLLGVVYHSVLSGTAGFGFSVLGALVGFLLLLLLFLIGAMGAGDVKLLAAVGAWLGAASTIWICLIACVATGFYALGICMAQGKLGRLVSPLRTMLLCVRSSAHCATVTEAVDVVAQREDRRRNVLPFALMISIGVILTAAGQCGALSFLRR